MYVLFLTGVLVMFLLYALQQYQHSESTVQPQLSNQGFAPEQVMATANASASAQEQFLQFMGHQGCGNEQNDLARTTIDRTQAVHTTAPWEPFDTAGTQQTDRSRALGLIAKSVIDSKVKEPALDLECSSDPAPCPENVEWQNTWAGCGSFHIPLKSKKYPLDGRVWQGDLNPKLQERQALLAKEWDPYAHMRARQAWMQFIAADFSSRSDKYMKPIDDLDAVDTRCLNEVEPVALY